MPGMFLARQTTAADSSKKRKQAFPRGLNGRNGAILRFRDGDQAFRAWLLAPAHAQVVAYQMKEGPLADKLARAPHGVPVPERLGLRNEADPAGMAPGGLRVAVLVARPNHDADFLDHGAERMLHEDIED